MSSILFLARKTLKNRILELKKKPGLLVLYVFLIVMIGFSLYSTSNANASGSAYNLPLLKVIFFAYLLIFVGIGISKGLSSGGSLFDMPDVNFLFLSPVKPASILAYGIIRQGSMGLLAGIFILFQGATLKGAFGIDKGGMLLLFFFFVISMLVCEIFAMVIYKFTSGQETRKKIVKLLMILFILPAIAVLFLNFGQGTMAMFSAVGTSPASSIVPIAGWMADAFYGFVTGNLAAGCLGLGATLLVAIAGCLAIVCGNTDYYEDVLLATETTFEKKSAQKKGNINQMNSSNRNIKVRGTGISGSGATAIFSRHIRESMRESRVFFLDNSTLFILAGGIIAALLLQDSLSPYMILYFYMYLKVFLIGNGRGLKDLFSHYLYLIPCSAFSKLVWSNAEVVFKTFAESVLLFTTISFIMHAGLGFAAMSTLTATTFSIILIGMNVLSLRIFKSSTNKGLLLFVYIIMVMILMVPGIAAAFTVYILIPEWFFGLGALLVLSLWDILCGMICIVLSRNVINHCDIPSLSQE